MVTTRFSYIYPALFSLLLAGLFLSGPAAAQDVDRESTSLVYESEAAQTQDKKGFLIFLREAPSRDQIRSLNERVQVQTQQVTIVR